MPSPRRSESARQGPVVRRPEMPRCLGVGLDREKDMVGAGHDVEFDGHAGGNESRGIFDILAHEKVDRSDADISWREPAEVQPARWHRAFGSIFRTRGHAEKRRPAEAVGVGGPDEGADVRGASACCCPCGRRASARAGAENRSAPRRSLAAADASRHGRPRRSFP